MCDWRSDRARDGGAPSGNDDGERSPVWKIPSGSSQRFDGRRSAAESRRRGSVAQ